MERIVRRARVGAVLLLCGLLAGFGYSWGYQAGARQTSAQAAGRRIDELTRWYAAAARRAGYAADRADEAEGGSAGRAAEPCRAASTEVAMP